MHHHQDKDQKEWAVRWIVKRNAELLKAGLDPSELTEGQIHTIVQPSEAPENYHMDGEITPNQAFTYWKQALKRNGLNRAQVRKAIRMNFK